MPDVAEWFVCLRTPTPITAVQKLGPYDVLGIAFAVSAAVQAVTGQYSVVKDVHGNLPGWDGPDA